MPLPLIGVAVGAIRAVAAIGGRGAATAGRAGAGGGRAARFGFRTYRGWQNYKKLREQLSNKRGRYVGGSLDIDMHFEYRDIEQSLKVFDKKVKKYALERSFNDVERKLAADTISAVRAVPYGRRGKLSKKKGTSQKGWIRMRGGLTKSKFKRRAIGHTKMGGFRLQQGISKIPLHWLESGTYGGTRWKGFPKGEGPRMKTALGMRKEIIRIVAKNMRRQVDAFQATGKLKTAKELRV